MECSSAQTKTFVLAAFLAFSSFNLLSEREPALKIAEYMDAQTRTNRFSGTVLVAKNGEVLLARGYGMANVERSVPNAPRTRFRLGPILHQFMAMAILELEKAGRLELHDSVCKYIEECPKEWQEIAIVNLLTHTSGISDLSSDENPARSSATIPQLLAAYKNESLAFKPGKNLRYSNFGYDLLGAVIERVSGEPYVRYLAEQIFKPLGMRDTRDYGDGPAIGTDRALGYRREGDLSVLVNSSCSHVSSSCGGGLYSTVQDLYRWDRALYSGRLVSKESLARMFSPYKDGSGFGWKVLEEFQRKTLTYSGKTDGFSTSIRRYPDDDACVIVLSNLEGVDADNITHDLGAIVFGMHYELPNEPRTTR